jgi:hypothetical protein
MRIIQQRTERRQGNNLKPITILYLARFMLFPGLIMLLLFSTVSCQDDQETGTRVLVVFTLEGENLDWIALNVFKAEGNPKPLSYIAGVKLSYKTDKHGEWLPSIKTDTSKDAEAFKKEMQHGKSVEAVQRDIDTSADGSWGVRTWRVLVEYIRRHSGEALPIAGKSYALIDLDRMIAAEEVNKIKMVRTGLASDVQIPVEVVQEVYDRIWQPENRAVTQMDKQSAPETSTLAGTDTPQSYQRRGNDGLSSSWDKSSEGTRSERDNLADNNGWPLFGKVLIALLGFVLLVFIYLIFDYYRCNRQPSTQSCYSGGNRRINGHEIIDPNPTAKHRTLMSMMEKIEQARHADSTSVASQIKYNMDKVWKNLDDIKIHIQMIEGYVSKNFDDVNHERASIDRRMSDLSSSMKSIHDQMDRFFEQTNKYQQNIHDAFFRSGSKERDSTPILGEIEQRLNYHAKLLKEIKEQIDRFHSANGHPSNRSNLRSEGYQESVENDDTNNVDIRDTQDSDRSIKDKLSDLF